MAKQDSEMISDTGTRERIDEQKINIMAENIAGLVYKNQLSTLKDTLDRFHIPEYYYSVLDEKDESSCLTYKDGEWAVFYSERGQKTNLRKMDDINDACACLLRDMADDDSEYRQMIEFFRHQVDGAIAIHPTLVELQRAVRNGFAKIAGIVL